MVDTENNQQQKTVPILVPDTHETTEVCSHAAVARFCH